MSENKYIAAFTETSQASYPAYISINKKDDVYVISMRQRGNTDGIILEIPKFDLARLCREIQANIGIDVNDEIDISNEEMLMLAKQAAGYTWVDFSQRDGRFYWRVNPDETRIWDPLTDDGDAVQESHMQDEPSIDALIAEIDGLERIDFDEGGCDYPCSDGDNYRFDDVRAVLNKYRGVK